MELFRIALFRQELSLPGRILIYGIVEITCTLNLIVLNFKGIRLYWRLDTMYCNSPVEFCWNSHCWTYWQLFTSPFYSPQITSPLHQTVLVSRFKIPCGLLLKFLESQKLAGIKITSRWYPKILYREVKYIRSHYYRATLIRRSQSQIRYHHFASPCIYNLFVANIITKLNESSRSHNNLLS